MARCAGPLTIRCSRVAGPGCCSAPPTSGGVGRPRPWLPGDEVPGASTTAGTRAGGRISDGSRSPRSVTGSERWLTGRRPVGTAPDGPRFEAGRGIDRVDHFCGLDRIVDVDGQRPALAQVRPYRLELVPVRRALAQLLGAGACAAGHDDPVVFVRLHVVGNGELAGRADQAQGHAPIVGHVTQRPTGRATGEGELDIHPLIHSRPTGAFAP